MYIARQKKKTNIAEYIIYMWQIEALIRSCEFNIHMVDEIIISQYQLNEDQYKETKEWYKGLIKQMKSEGLTKSGHISEIKHIISELNMLHDMLLNMFKDQKYQELFDKAEPNILELKKKSGTGSDLTNIEICLNGLYGILTLKMRKKEISKDTEEAINTFSQLMVFLTRKYHDMKEGKFVLPDSVKN